MITKLTNQTPAGKLKSFLGLDDDKRPVKQLPGQPDRSRSNSAKENQEDTGVSIEAICTDALLTHFRIRLVPNPDYEKGFSINPHMVERLPDWR